jgi:hypothetical protein
VRAARRAHACTHACANRIDLARARRDRAVNSARCWRELDRLPRDTPARAAESRMQLAARRRHQQTLVATLALLCVAAAAADALAAAAVDPEPDDPTSGTDLPLCDSLPVMRRYGQNAKCRCAHHRTWRPRPAFSQACCLGTCGGVARARGPTVGGRAGGRGRRCSAGETKSVCAQGSRSEHACCRPEGYTMPGEIKAESPRGGDPVAAEPKGKIHRVDPKFASRPSSLTGNPYKSLRVDPNCGSTL